MPAPSTILIDIEGTASSISFVKDVLFPYARQHLPSFVRTHADDPKVKHWLDATANEVGLDPADTSALINTLTQWIDNDRKATPLKALQGMIWADGYASGAYRAHVYPDVAPCLRQWHAQGMALYIYSSGSVQAQQLFFRHSEAGDLTPLLRGYFDTRIGPKREPCSYTAIAQAISQPATDILFLSDVHAELDAAATAGMHTIRLCRPPEPFPDDVRHPCVTDFTAIHLA